MTRPATTHLYVCRKCKGSSRLAAQLATEIEQRQARRPGGAPVAVELVRCQDICKAPVAGVAGVAVEGELTWFRRVSGRKVRAGLVKLAVRGGTGPVPKRLAPAHVPTRDGRPVRR